MFIELVDTLRCPRAHDETWLVARIDRIDGRHIVAGSLGCPICRAQYSIVDGVLDLRDAGATNEHVVAAGDASVPPNDDDVARAAALLGLSEPGGLVVLAGSAGLLADRLETMTSVNLMLVSPTPNVARSPHRSIVLTSQRLPLAPGVVKGVMTDATTALPAFLDDAQRALATGGRLVAPAHAPLPEGVEELARDAREWVAVKGAAPVGMVSLGRR